MILLALLLGVQVSLGAKTSTWMDRIKIPTPQIEEYPNGLQVVWFEDHRLPLVDLVLLFRSGDRNDPKGKSGTAQLFSSLLDRGSEGVTGEELALRIESLGASRYSSGDSDTITVGVHGMSEDRKELIRLLKLMTLKPTFPKSEFQKERKQFLDRWRHIGDHGSSLANLVFGRVVQSGTLYARGGFLSPREFKRIKREDVVRFHGEHVSPDNAILMVVGDINPKTFGKEVIQEFGSWSRSKKKDRWVLHRHSDLLPGKRKAVVVNRKGLTQTQVRVGFEAPLISNPDHHALLVANALFGEHFSSRLNRALREQMALTYSVGSSFSYQNYQATFSISSSSRNETTGVLVETILDLLKDFQKGEVSEDEVRVAKDYLIGGYPIGTSGIAAIASRWLVSHVFNLGPNYMREFIPRVNAVTRQQVTEAIRKHLRKTPKVVIAGDYKELTKGLKAAGVWPVRKVELSALR